jgi:hypothetical protein
VAFSYSRRAAVSGPPDEGLPSPGAAPGHHCRGWRAGRQGRLAYACPRAMEIRCFVLTACANGDLVSARIAPLSRRDPRSPGSGIMPSLSRALEIPELAGARVRLQRNPPCRALDSRFPGLAGQTPARTRIWVSRGLLFAKEDCSSAKKPVRRSSPTPGHPRKPGGEELKGRGNFMVIPSSLSV